MMPTGSLPRCLASKTGSFVISHEWGRFDRCSISSVVLDDGYLLLQRFFRVPPPPIPCPSHPIRNEEP